MDPGSPVAPSSLTSRYNGPSNSSLVINTPSRRTNLFASHQVDENAARHADGTAARATSSRSASFDFAIDSKSNAQTFGSTKIPRPAPTETSGHRRRPFTLTDAFRVAARQEEGEAVAQGSPSPAPRSWRMPRDKSESKTQQPAYSTTKGPEPRDTPTARTARQRQSSDGRDSLLRGSDSDLKAEDNQKAGLIPSVPKAIPPVISSPKRTGSNREAYPSQSSPPRATLLHAVPAINPSPEKSFAWQADADFTASDLQVSTSPPVKLGRSSAGAINPNSSTVDVNRSEARTSTPLLRNNKIDEIRAREADALFRFPDGQDDPIQDVDGPPALDLSVATSSPRDRLISRQNTKIDEIRARERESMSRRALASAKLDDIRERNSHSQSRSFSPPASRTARHSLPLSTAVPLEGALQDKPKLSAQPFDKLMRLQDGSGENLPLFSRVPRAETAFVSRQDTRRNRPVNSAVTRKGDIHKGDAKPTVEFAGIRRDSSTESNVSSRSTTARSDSDPTDRIEGEMDLFAPREDYSERGSQKGPSPELTSDEDQAPPAEETPKPTKPDPLTQPTPQVTGAYVETPVTIKAGAKHQDNLTFAKVVRHTQPSSQSDVEGETDSAVRDNLASESGLGPSPRAMLRETRTNNGTRIAKQALPAAGEKITTQATSSSSRRRARSFSRARSPLVNSVKPPTVKDDLLAINRDNQLDDSTLDDFADLLGSQATAQASSYEGRQPDDTKVEISAEEHLSRELKAYDRMHKSLRTGLLGIRTAKQGIERLEDKVAHADVKIGADTGSAPTHAHCPSCHGTSSRNHIVYLHLPVPQLWRRRPTFKLTPLGILVLIFSLWYVVESTMCYFYCKPEVCYGSSPCRWSHDDPFWGVAIPVKLDQWATGGRARARINQAAPDVADWMADIWDTVTGTDIKTVDTRYYTWSQKRQHRRRLIKKNLVRTLPHIDENSAKYDSWKTARLAQQRVQAARDVDYGVEEHESMDADEKIR